MEGNALRLMFGHKAVTWFGRTYPNLVGKQVEFGLSRTGDSGRRAEIPGYNHGIANRKPTKESVETKPTRSNEMEILAASLLSGSQAIKHDSLGIPRSAILADILSAKPLFHDNPPRFIKAATSALHDGLYSFFTLLI